MKDFLNKLGIDTIGQQKGNTYTIDLKDSNEYGRIYSKLDRSELVDELVDSSQMTIDNSSIQFESDDYIITLLADFVEDNYKLTIRER